MKRTNFYFPDQMLDELRKASERTGLSVSALIRNAVKQYLEKHK